LYRSAQHRILGSPPFAEKSQKSFAGSFVMTFLLASACNITGATTISPPKGHGKDNAPMPTDVGVGGKEDDKTAFAPKRLSEACASTAAVCAKYLFCKAKMHHERVRGHSSWKGAH
jgi:hypothetical protein